MAKTEYYIHYHNDAEEVEDVEIVTGDDDDAYETAEALEAQGNTIDFINKAISWTNYASDWDAPYETKTIWRA